jgi:hypothetical protein
MHHSFGARTVDASEFPSWAVNLTDEHPIVVDRVSLPLAAAHVTVIYDRRRRRWWPMILVTLAYPFALLASVVVLVGRLVARLARYVSGVAGLEVPPPPVTFEPGDSFLRLGQSFERVSWLLLSSTRIDGRRAGGGASLSALRSGWADGEPFETARRADSYPEQRRGGVVVADIGQGSPTAPTSPESPTWIQTERVWDLFVKHHPNPETYMDALLAIVEKDFGHRQRLERSAHRLNWAIWWRQLSGFILGFVAFGVCAMIAREYLSSGNPVAGAWILCTGSVPITALFVTGTLVRPARIPASVTATPAVPAQVPPSGV